MKKFILFLVFALVVSTFVATALRLNKDKEELIIQPSNAYYNVGETIAFNYTVKNASKKVRAGITVEVEAGKEDIILQREDGTFSAGFTGGDASIVVTLTNARGKKHVYQKFISVGDGTWEHPWFVRNEEELLAIGKGTAAEKADKLNEHWLQVANISLTAPFTTIAGSFNGSYRGISLYDESAPTGSSYAKINDFSNATSTGQTLETSAMFESIGKNGLVGYLSFHRVNIEGSFVAASLIAGTNHGRIDYINAESGTIKNTNTSGVVGGLVGFNNSSDREKQATISRCNSALQLISLGKSIGGIAWKNDGTIGYCENSGTIEFENAAAGVKAGGIAGINTWNESVLFYSGGKKLLTDARDRLFDFQRDYPGATVPDAILSDLNVALELRPRVKDNSFTGSFVNLSLPGSYLVGGIIGEEIHGYTKDADISDLQYDNLTMGNYYLKTGEGAARLLQRGIGNMSYTAEIERDYFVIAGVDADNFVATGILKEDFKTGILIDAFGSVARRDLVSFVQDGKIEYWQDSGYRITSLNSNEMPITIKPDKNDFAPLMYKGPNYSIGSMRGGWQEFFGDPSAGIIPINFTEKASYGAKKFTLTEDIDFNEVDPAVLASYFEFKGRAGKPAYFEINAEPVVVGGVVQTDEFGNIVYYGFKNLNIPALGSYAGLFGYAQDSVMRNVRFENCTFAAAADTTDIGLVVGTANNVILDGIVAVNCTVTGGAATRNIGGLIGASTGNAAIVANCFADIIIDGTGVASTASNPSYAGGLIGRSVATTLQNNRVNININISTIYAGGVTGYVGGNTKIQTTQISGKVSALEAGGIAHTLYGNITRCITDTELLGLNTSAGIANEVYNGANANNCQIKTKFAQGGNYRAGLAINLRLGSEFANIIHENNFIGGTAGQNYSRTYNLAKLSHYDDQIDVGSYLVSSGQIYNANSAAGTINNCFVINLVNGAYNINAEQTTFYRNNKSSGSGDVLTSYNPTVRQVTVWQFAIPPWYYDLRFGTWGGCVLNSTGTNVVVSDPDPNFTFSYTKAGFSSIYWAGLDGKPYLKLA